MWIRRQGAELPPFALRFAVQQGRGVLRLDLDGVLVDTPADVRGEEGIHHAAAVARTRFLHLVHNNRDEYRFERLGTGVINALPPDRWHELVPVEDGGYHTLTLHPITPQIRMQSPGKKAQPWHPEPPTSVTRKAPNWQPTSGEITPDASPLRRMGSDAQRPAVSADARLSELQREIDRERRRVAGLTRRIAELERKLETHGIAVGPFEIDTRIDPK